jgi:hypothetical protein
LGQLPDPQQQQIVETMVTGMVAEKLPIARCPVLDRLLAILSPCRLKARLRLLALPLVWARALDRRVLAKS